MSGNGIRCFAQALAMRRGDALPQTMPILTDAGTRAVALTPTEDPGHDPGRRSTWERSSTSARPSTWADRRLGCPPRPPDRPPRPRQPAHGRRSRRRRGGRSRRPRSRASPTSTWRSSSPAPSRNAVTMRVHERGVGLTEACGTGACAAAVAATRWGLVPRIGRGNRGAHARRQRESDARPPGPRAGHPHRAGHLRRNDRDPLP